MKENMLYNAKMFQLREENVQRILEIIQRPCSGGNIVFFGDSITQQFPIEVLLESEFSLINSGVGGFNSETLKWIVDEAVIRYSPTQVFIMIGTNDLGDTLMNSPKDIAMNIMDIVDTLQSNLPDCEVHVISILPCIEELHGFQAIHRGIRSNSIIEVTNREIQYYLRDRATYIDLYSLFMDKNHNPIERYYRDGLHLSDEGYRCYSDHLKPFMKIKR